VGLSPKKYWGQKCGKFRSILYLFRLWSQISPERGSISKIGKQYELGQFLLRLMKKVRWTLVHYRQFHASLVPLKCTFWDTISRPSGVLCPEIFTLARHWPRLPSAHTPTWTGSLPPKKNYSQIFKIWLKVQRLSLYNFHASGNILTKLLQETWWTLVHKQKSYSTHIDLPEVLVHCKLTQVYTPRGSRIQFT